MKNIDNKIKSLYSQIEFKQNLINRLIDNHKMDKKLVEIIQEEILTLKRKVIILEEQQKTGMYIPKKPTLGDDRYKKFADKEALDILRVLYYDFFHKDPNLSATAINYMFGDPTLPIYTSSYLIRGEIPFDLMLTTHYQDYRPIDNCSVGISFNKNNLVNERGIEYLKLMVTLIKRYSNNEPNFICCDGRNRNCTLSYIGNKSFSYDTTSSQKRYYDFFESLCY